MRFLIVVSLVLIARHTAFSQCCSPGNPVGGSTNIGILDKKSFRLISYYRYSFSEGYLEGRKKSDFGIVKNANFNYAGLVLGYGLLNKLTIETELGYFINKSQTYDIEPSFTNKGFGFNNAVLSLKYNVISKTEKPFEWTIGAGGKIPFTRQYQVVDNVELPRDVQPSTNTFGTMIQSFLYKGFPEQRIKLFLINRFETNTPDGKNYKFGNSFMTSFFFARQISQSNFTAILQARYEYRGKDILNVTNSGCFGCFSSGSYINSSGGNLIFIAPQINYTIAKKWNLSLLSDLPIYRKYNGTQLGNKFAFALYLSRDFGGKCEVK